MIHPMPKHIKGKKTSSFYISINTTKMIRFSSSFVRDHKLKKYSYIAFGYDKKNHTIGIKFVKKSKNMYSIYKLITSDVNDSIFASFSNVISYYNLDLLKIIGKYGKEKVEGPIKISGFARKGFLLHLKTY